MYPAESLYYINPTQTLDTVVVPQIPTSKHFNSNEVSSPTLKTPTNITIQHHQNNPHVKQPLAYVNPKSAFKTYKPITKP